MNEIYKGMDNAAEQINENFEKTKVESGSDENGRWIKYPDGTMECFMKPLEVHMEDRNGVLYQSSGFIWTFPQEFEEIYIVDVQNRSFGSIGGYVTDVTNQSCKVRGVGPQILNGTITATAFGRFK